MGGHGALVIGLRNPSLFASVSALAPICAPSACPWGRKALGGYLGPDEGAWAAYDACALVQVSVKEGGGGGLAWACRPGLGRPRGRHQARTDPTNPLQSYAGPSRHLLVDVGGDDEFLETQLRPGDLRAAVERAGAASRSASAGPAPPTTLTLDLNTRPGYDHSYFFIASFIDAHVAHAAAALGVAGGGRE